MARYNWLEKPLNTLFEKYKDDNSSFLLHASAVGWVLSALAQCTAIVLNDKLSPEKKKFLIPQEMADGVVNVGLFYAFTSMVMKVASDLFNYGKISTKETKELLKKGVVSLDSKAKNFLGKVLKDPQVLGESILKENESIIKSLKSKKGGMVTLTGLFGSVVSCNIATPYLRNIYGAYRQKQLMQIDKPKTEQKYSMPSIYKSAFFQPSPAFRSNTFKL